MSDLCAPHLKNVWNKEIVSQQQFHDDLKLVDVAPVFKREDSTLLKNYRSVIALPVVSKIFERLQK